MKRIHEQSILITILVIIIGGIGITMATGLWSTESTKVPVKFETGDFAGEYNPEDIRGSYTFAEIASVFDIPEETLKTAFGIAADVPADSIQSKELETMFPEEVEIGNDAMKAFVSLYKGIPYELTGLILPDAAVDIILNLGYTFDEATLSAIEATRLSTYEMTAEDDAGADAATDTTDAADEQTATVEPADAEEEEPAINGNTTFMQALEAGISETDIEAIIGGDMPSTAMTIKDYCVNNGLSFSTVKTALTAQLESQQQ
jgi:hypothetical protein